MARKNEIAKHRRGIATESRLPAGATEKLFSGGASPYLVPFILVLFVFAFVLTSTTSFLQKSPTVDEPVHLLSGYANLKWGDYRANPEHPPLAKMWAALPLLFMNVNDPRPTSADWDRIPTASPRALHTVNVASQLLFIDNDAESLFFYAKLMMITLAVALGIFIFKWSRELFGLSGALASLFFYALDPNILAHSQLVHTDLPFTTFFFIATFFYCRSLNQLNGRNLALTMLFFSLAVVTKYAYSVILLLWVILGATTIIFSEQPLDISIGKSITVTKRWQKLFALMGIFACALASAYVLVWMTYGFRFDAVPGGQLRLPMAEELPKAPVIRALINRLLEYRLFPEAWIYGQLHVYNNLARDTYLLGKMLIGEGSWLYFPVAFAVKTPLPTLLLFFGAFAFWYRERHWRWPQYFLLISILVYFAFAVGSGINIGLRHILPIYPFIYVLIGGTVAALWAAKTRLTRGIIGVMCVWSFASTALTHPSYLAFFNELAGGPSNGHKILLDSNLDWGQDLKGLKRWMVQHRVQKMQFLYFGFFNAAAPRYYGINAMFLPGSWVGGHELTRESSKPPVYLAISANLLYGRFQGGADEGFVTPFRSITPVATIGNSILVYNFDLAVKQYSEIVQANVTSAEPHFYFGNLLNHQGYKQEAVQEFRRAIQIAPEFAEAHNNLGGALLKLGALDEAIPHLRKALEIKPLDHRYETQFQLGAAFAKHGNLPEAARYFKESVTTRPEFVPAHYNLGIVRAAQGDMSTAIFHFRDALRLDPENAEAHVALARALVGQNQKEEAAKHFKEAIRILKTSNQTATVDQPRP